MTDNEKKSLPDFITEICDKCRCKDIPASETPCWTCSVPKISKAGGLTMEQKQIDALRAMLADATPGEWVLMERYAMVVCAPGKPDDFTICEATEEADARLIAAMHNALPALLDAVEFAKAIRWFVGEYGGVAGSVLNDMCDIETEVLAAYRERV